MKWLAVFAFYALASTPVFAQENSEIPSTDPFIQALASAYSTNPRLLAAREGLKATDEGVAEAYSALRPTVDANYGKGRARRSVGPVENFGYYDTTSKGLSVEQPLFSGEMSGGISAAKARMKAERAALRSTEQATLLDAASIYTEVAANAAVLDLSRKNADVLTRHYEESKARFEAGILTLTDVKQAEARLALSQAEMQQAEAALAAARAAYARIIGTEAAAVSMPEVSLKLPATLEEAKLIAVDAAPALQQATFMENEMDSMVDVRAGNLLPDVSLRGSMARTDGSNIPGSRQIDQDSLTLNVSIPLYQGGAEYARLRQAKKQHQQAKFNTSDAKNAVLENVTSAWHQHVSMLAVMASNETAVRAATSALEGVTAEYQNGSRTTLDVLDAERELFASEVALVQAKRNKIVTAFTLLASIGGLSAEQLALPVELYHPAVHYDDVKWLPIGF